MTKVETRGKKSSRDQNYEKAEKYLLGDWQSRAVKNVIPSVAGLACYLGFSRETMYQWAEQCPKWKSLLSSINTLQEVKIIDGTLRDGWNANFAKMLMVKHGYTEKQEIDHTSSDGTMTPRAPQYKIVSE
jgi:hypothetical protein